MFICLRHLIFKRMALVTVLLAGILAIAGPGFAEDAELQRKYDEIIAEERRLSGAEQHQEYIASGVAAIVLGLYGYYNTDPNPIIKLIYAATQTAGVVTVGQAVRDRHAPRMLVDIDRQLKDSVDGKTVDTAKIKREVVLYKQNAALADARTLAYTSSILSGLYFYNGYRESGADHTLRNIYYFLGFNFAIGGAVGFYRSHNLEDQQLVEIGVFPYPSVAYRF